MDYDDEEGVREHWLPSQKAFGWGTALAAGTLAFAVFSWGSGLYDDLRSRIEHLGGSIVGLQDYRDWHDREATRWKDEIIANRKDVAELQQEVARLGSIPTARPDPFTGTDGRRLEERIKRLEGSAQP